MPSGENPQFFRKAWLGCLARAPRGRARELLDAASPATSPAIEWLRRPEIGSVMVRGRAGGTGAPFNLGEMTVTRASLKLPDGTVGHGYVQGRSRDDAETAALIDALMQTNAAAEVERQVLGPLEAEDKARRNARADKAAATKVDFFTLVRGED